MKQVPCARGERSPASRPSQTGPCLALQRRKARQSHGETPPGRLSPHSSVLTAIRKRVITEVWKVKGFTHTYSPVHRKWSLIYSDEEGNGKHHCNGMKPYCQRAPRPNPGSVPHSFPHVRSAVWNGLLGSSGKARLSLMISVGKRILWVIATMLLSHELVLH